MWTHLWLPTAFCVHSHMPKNAADTLIPVILSVLPKYLQCVFFMSVYLHVSKGSLRCQSNSLPLVLLSCPFGGPLAARRPLIRHRTVWGAGLSIRQEAVGTVGTTTGRIIRAMQTVHLICFTLKRTVDGSSWCPAGAPRPAVCLMTSYMKPASVSAPCHSPSERGFLACPLRQRYQSLKQGNVKNDALFYE